MGESVYNDDFVQVVVDLIVKGLFIEDNGVLCVFFEEFRNVEGNLFLVIVQKVGGGYFYVIIDFVVMCYWYNVLYVDCVLYFVDQCQVLYFQQVFEVVWCVGFVLVGMELEYMGFGIMNGVDGCLFKICDGGMVKLIDLLEEVESCVYVLVKECNEQCVECGEELFDEVQLCEIGWVVGIDLVKYVDLFKYCISDYSFNFELMLSFEGNIVFYLFYVCICVVSVFCKFGQGCE